MSLKTQQVPDGPGVCVRVAPGIYIDLFRSPVHGVMMMMMIFPLLLLLFLPASTCHPMASGSRNQEVEWRTSATIALGNLRFLVRHLTC